MEGEPQAFSAFFFFNDTATTEIYTLSLHDALPFSAAATTSLCCRAAVQGDRTVRMASCRRTAESFLDRKSTRLNSSHSQISYAVFCLKKKARLALLNPYWKVSMADLLSRDSTRGTG